MILAQMAQVDTDAILEPSLDPRQVPRSCELVAPAHILFDETGVLYYLETHCKKANGSRSEQR